MKTMHGYPDEPARLGDVLVLGLGTSGAAAASYLARLVGSRVDSLTVYAGKRTASAERTAADLERACGARVVFDSEDVAGSYGLCVVSPGISEFSDFYASARRASAEMASEVEFAWRESPADSRWVAITGTNGKTTTTALTAHVLRQAGLAAVACGNIGDACIAEVAAGRADVFVAEVSSYQLASTSRFCPDVAVLLNITPDHVKWHRSLENYAAAKYKVLANLPQAPDGVAVLDAVNDVVREGQVRRLRAQTREERGFDYVPIGCAAGLSASMRDACGSENAAFLDDGVLRVDFRGREHRVMPASALRIKGEHNAGNALAAAAVGFALGLSDDDVRRGLEGFAPLEHRIEPCGSAGGVACYNDSKATNVDATLKALSAFGEVRPIVLLGGDDKGTDLSELVSAARRHCKAVVCFGASKERFLEAFGGVSEGEGTLRVLTAEHLEDALDAALDAASPGDVVALSPACASFDEFTCYQERGKAFKRMVEERSRREGD